MKLNGPWALHKKQTTMLQNVVAKQTEDLHEVQSYQDMLRKKLEHSNKSYSELKASYMTLQTHSNSVQERLTDVEARLRKQSLAYDAKVAALDDKTDMVKFLRGQLDLETEANQAMTRGTHELKTALQASDGFSMWRARAHGPASRSPGLSRRMIAPGHPVARVFWRR